MASGDGATDWHLISLGELVHLETGKRARGGAVKEGVLSLGGEHISADGQLLLHNPKFIPVDFFASLKTGKVRARDVLLVKDGARTGKCAFVREEVAPRVAVNEHVFVLRPRDLATLDAEFLYFWLLSPAAQQQIRLAYHGLIGGIKREDVFAMRISLPPIEEQREVAKVLRTVQRGAELTERVIAAGKALKESLRARLFDDQGWPKVRLGDEVTLQRGYDLPAKDRRAGSVPVVSSSGVTGIHEEGKASGPGVVIGRYGTLGAVHFIDSGPYWPLNTTLFVKDFHGNEPRFVRYMLETIEYSAHNDKTSVPGVNRNALHALSVRWPPREVQQQVARMLDTVLQKISAEESRYSALEEVFKALLGDLITGKFRVGEHLKVA